MTRILIAEDEERISSFVSKGLRAAGYTPMVVASGTDAVRQIHQGGYDLVLLDVGLPGIDGFEVLRRIRVHNQTLPVIMLTARTAVADTVAGLDAGASDYLAKPFRFDELLARMRSRLRVAEQVEAEAASMLVHGDIRLDLLARRATVAGRTVDLSTREFALAEEFLRNPGEVLSREVLLSRVWDVNFDPGSNVVDVYVRYLRSKIGPGRIETVRGEGYRLR